LSRCKPVNANIQKFENHVTAQLLLYAVICWPAVNRKVSLAGLLFGKLWLEHLPVGFGNVQACFENGSFLNYYFFNLAY